MICQKLLKRKKKIMETDIASSRPQTLTEILMDTQTEIKDLVKQAMFSVLVMITFNEKLKKLLDTNLAEIKDEELRAKYRQSLEKFAMAEYKTMINLLKLGNLPIILSSFAYNISEGEKEQLQKSLNNTLKRLGKADVNKAFSQLGNSQAKQSFGQSVYGSSELAMRFEEHRQELIEMKAKTNLVIIDTHSDCSDRCFPWQGRVYSLDGTSGTTDDGRQYVPIEVAINDTTFGKNNGLFGYNCRHHPTPYKKGLKPNKVTLKEQQREKEISNTQRRYERKIREAKDKAMAFTVKQKNVAQFNRNTRLHMAEQAEKYRQRARSLTEEYEAFCRENNRVIYRSRIKI